MQEILAGQGGGDRANLRKPVIGKILQEIFAANSCGKFLQENLAGKSSGKSCGKILWEMLWEIPHTYPQTISEGNFQNMQFI